MNIERNEFETWKANLNEVRVEVGNIKGQLKEQKTLVQYVILPLIIIVGALSGVNLIV